MALPCLSPATEFAFGGSCSGSRDMFAQRPIHARVLRLRLQTYRQTLGFGQANAMPLRLPAMAKPCPHSKQQGTCGVWCVLRSSHMYIS